MANLLIVDDVAISRTTLTRVLREAGHNITPAASGQEALARARMYTPDLVILDLNMPNMNGLATAAALRAALLDQTPPLLIISGMTLGELEFKEVLAIADGFLRKPFAPVELCAKVEALVGPRSAPPSARSAAEGLKGRFQTDLSQALLVGVLAPGPARGAPTQELLQSVVPTLRGVEVLDDSPQHLMLLWPAASPLLALGGAERVRQAARSLRCSLSAGLAAHPGPGTGTPTALLEAAEAALQHAQQDGNGSLCLHPGYLLSCPHEP